VTAPDPRLNEIQARIGRLLSNLAWAETPEERDDAENELTADVRYLLAELRKAHEALGRVEALADKWESLAGPGSEAERIYKVEQKVSVAFAVARIRAAVAAAKRVS